MLNSLENLMNILRISGEMSLWKAWDQFWAVKGQKKRAWLRMGPRNFQKQVSYYLVVYAHGRGI